MLAPDRPCAAQAMRTCSSVGSVADDQACGEHAHRDQQRQPVEGVGHPDVQARDLQTGDADAEQVDRDQRAPDVEAAGLELRGAEKCSRVRRQQVGAADGLAAGVDAR